jgi:hypothetical protein
MRGSDAMTGSLFSYVDIEARIPANHPVRPIRRIVNEVLTDLDGEFAAMYSGIGRPSIAPERLLRGSLLQIFFSVRSERQRMVLPSTIELARWVCCALEAVKRHQEASENAPRQSLDGRIGGESLVARRIRSACRAAPVLWKMRARCVLTVVIETSSVAATSAGVSPAIRHSSVRVSAGERLNSSARGAARTPTPSTADVMNNAALARGAMCARKSPLASGRTWMSASSPSACGAGTPMPAAPIPAS